MRSWRHRIRSSASTSLCPGVFTSPPNTTSIFCPWPSAPPVWSTTAAVWNERATAESSSSRAHRFAPPSYSYASGSVTTRPCVSTASPPVSSSVGGLVLTSVVLCPQRAHGKSP